MQVKACARCGETKPLDEFHNRSDVKSGKNAACKQCVNERGRAAWDNFRQRRLRERYAARTFVPQPESKRCNDCGLTKPIESFSDAKGNRDGKQRRCRECSARYRLMRRYGLTPEGFQSLLEAQGGVCALCSQLTDGPWHVDHDHACCSGHLTCGSCIRAILCAPCNKAIGFLRDDPNLALAAAAYLMRFDTACPSKEKDTQCQSIAL